MTSDAAKTAEADRHYREWMRGNLAAAAARFDLTIDGVPTFGWLDRSISAAARYGSEQRWLRVVTEQPEWSNGDTWTGTVDANTLTSLPRPLVLATFEWRDNPYRHVRAEVMTRIPGHACSDTTTPPPTLVLPQTWWNALASALNELKQVHTRRVNSGRSRVDQRMRWAFGHDLTAEVECWETVHGDLHWGNLFRAPFGIIDWELWGTGPAGTDEATLYLYSLGVPRIARAVYAHFADVLDAPDGQRAQLYVAARLLHRSTFGDHPELVRSLWRLVAGLKL